MCLSTPEAMQTALSHGAGRWVGRCRPYGWALRSVYSCVPASQGRRFLCLFKFQAPCCVRFFGRRISPCFGLCFGLCFRLTLAL